MGMMAKGNNYRQFVWITERHLTEPLLISLHGLDYNG